MLAELSVAYHEGGEGGDAIADEVSRLGEDREGDVRVVRSAAMHGHLRGN